MLASLAAEIPGYLGMFFFKFVLLPVCSTILGIIILVWASRRLRQSGRSRPLPLIGLAFLQLLLIPSLTAFFSFQYAGNSVAAAFLDSDSKKLSSWVAGKGTELMRARLPAEGGGGTVDLGKILDVAASRKREIGSSLPAAVSEAVAQGIDFKNAAGMGAMRMDQIPVVAEYWFWGAVAESAHATGLSGNNMTWESLAEKAGAKFTERTHAVFAEMSGGFRVAAIQLLVTIIVLNATAVLLIVFIVSRLVRVNLASAAQPR